MAPLIDALRGEGVEVVAPVLPGHDEEAGSTMPGSTWLEWLEAAEAAFDALVRSTEGGRVVVVGFSTGATLALALASRRPVDRLVLLAPFLAIRFARWFLISPRVWLKPVARVIPDLPRRGPATLDRRVRRELARSSQFQTFSLAATVSALELIHRVVPTLGSITTPALILQGARDSVVEPSRATWLLDQLGSVEKRLIWFARSDHLLAWDHDRAAVIEAVMMFFNDS